jgi:hypothetical protein
LGQSVVAVEFANEFSEWFGAGVVLEEERHLPVSGCPDAVAVWVDRGRGGLQYDVGVGAGEDTEVGAP